MPDRHLAAAFPCAHSERILPTAQLLNLLDLEFAVGYHTVFQQLLAKCQQVVASASANLTPPVS